MHYINMWISSGHTAGRHVILQKTYIYTPQQYNYGRYVVDYSAANSIYSIIFQSKSQNISTGCKRTCTNTFMQQTKLFFVTLDIYARDKETM